MLKSKGFTLIEVVIVLLIIGIIALFAIPNYIDYIRKSRRVDGAMTLLNIVMAQAKHRTNNTSYASLATVWGTTTSPEGYYTLAMSGVSATGYTVTATGVGNQANDSDDGVNCSPLTIVVNGLNTTKTPTDCWS